jgi:hypothetical protein
MQENYQKNRMRYFLLFIFLGINSFVFCQSFSDEKTAAINYIKRAYNVAPFEGIRLLEGDEKKYYAVAVSFYNIPKDSINHLSTKALISAQSAAEQGFAEPCVKFEMIEHIDKGKDHTFLFFCVNLGQFVTELFSKKIFDGARIISSPANKYIISTVTLENAKYVSPEMKDKAAFMKAKQLVNTMMNGSVITSDQIIRTDVTDAKTEVTSTEFIREQAMGFVQGLELLFGKELTPNKTTYVYYSKI